MFDHIMTVVRLSPGNLLVHSPSSPSAALFAEIDQLGSTTDVVAPNWFHDLYLREYRAAYPSATFWGPRKLVHDMAGVVTAVLDQNTRADWSAELPHAIVPGLLTFDESIFFHRASQTLIVADLLTTAKPGPDANALTRVSFRFSGMDGRLTMLPYLRLFRFTVARALDRAAEQTARWDPQRLIVGHGEPLAVISPDATPQKVLAGRELTA